MRCNVPTVPLLNPQPKVREKHPRPPENSTPKKKKCIFHTRHMGGWRRIFRRLPRRRWHFLTNFFSERRRTLTCNGQSAIFVVFAVCSFFAHLGHWFLLIRVAPPVYSNSDFRASELSSPHENSFGAALRQHGSLTHTNSRLFFFSCSR